MPDLFVPSAQQTQPAQTTQDPLVQPPTKPQQNNTPSAPISPTAPVETASHRISWRTTFCQNPSGVTLRDQDADETILLFLRRDFITNVPWIVISIFLFALPFLLMLLFMLPLFHNVSIFGFLPPQFRQLLLLFYLLLILAYALIKFITWFFNIFFVTNKRIVIVKFSSLVYKDVFATKLNLVQDTSFSQIGIIRSFFDFGDVMIQTAGAAPNFIFEAVPRPETVVQIIEDLIGKDNDV